MTIPYEIAKNEAESVIQILAPCCQKIDIVGGIRRRLSRVVEISLVVLPDDLDPLFGSEFKSKVDQWHKTIGHLPCKYLRRRLPSGFEVDIHIATASNYGYKVAAATGPNDFVWKVLGSAWKRNGYCVKDGHIYSTSDGLKVDVPTEKELFELCDINYIIPPNRIVRHRK